GGLYVDPATHPPLDLPFSSLIDDAYFTDPQSRTNAQQIGLGLDALRALVAPSSVPLSAALAQMNDLVTVGGQRVSEVLSAKSPTRPVYYKVTDFETGNVIAQGKTDVSGQVDFFAGSNKSLFIQVFDPENMGYGEQFV